jgi:hypothetical protein
MEPLSDRWRALDRTARSGRLTGVQKVDSDNGVVERAGAAEPLDKPSIYSPTLATSRAGVGRGVLSWRGIDLLTQQLQYC